MLIQKEFLPAFPDFHSELDYHPESSLFFDIETTGLSPASGEVFLIGTVHRENDAWILTQLLSESPGDEESVLRAFLDFSESFTQLIHFNGTTFDLPFIRTRAERYHLTVPKQESLDLYQSFRPLKRLLSLDRMNQQTLEKAVNWNRTDELTGKHMTALFQTWQKTHDAELQRLLLLHNHDDLVGMTRILSLASLLKPEIDPSETVTSEFDEDVWSLSFRLATALPLKLTKELPGLYRFEAETDQAVLAVSGHRGELKYFFPDYKNYVYLPLEDQAIHKNAALGVDREFKVPAKKDTCYTRKSGLFLPQPGTEITPAFRRTYSEKQLYFEYSSSGSENPEFLNAYISSVLSLLFKKQ